MHKASLDESSCLDSPGNQTINSYSGKILLYAHTPKLKFFLSIDVFFDVDSKYVIKIFWPALVFK